MNYRAKLAHYQSSASREEEAAARAATTASAGIHRALADMYRREAAKIDAVREVIRLALD